MKGFLAHWAICLSSATVLLPAGGLHVLQEGKACRVNVHGDGVGLGGVHKGHLFFNQLHVPGLHGGDAPAIHLPNGLGSALHHGGVDAVAGEGQDAGVRAGGDQNIVIAHVVVFIAVVELHRAHGCGEDGQVHLMAEEVIRGVHAGVFADGVHVDAQLLPLLVVADGAGADALGAGAGHGVLAGKAVAHGTGLAEGAHAGPGRSQNFLISHRGGSSLIHM